MSTLIPNTLQFPNLYVDDLMALLTPEEVVCLLFAARQILGWEDTRQTRRARISLSTFCHGYKVRGQQVNKGTGLSVGAVTRAVAALCKFGILKRVGTNSDGTEYLINFDPQAIDFDGLKARADGQRRTNRARTSKATRAMRHRRGVSSDYRLGSTSDDRRRYMSDENIETQESKEISAAAEHHTDDCLPTVAIPETTEVIEQPAKSVNDDVDFPTAVVPAVKDDVVVTAPGTRQSKAAVARIAERLKALCQTEALIYPAAGKLLKARAGDVEGVLAAFDRKERDARFVDWARRTNPFSVILDIQAECGRITNRNPLQTGVAYGEQST